MKLGLLYVGDTIQIPRCCVSRLMMVKKEVLCDI